MQPTASTPADPTAPEAPADLSAEERERQLHEIEQQIAHLAAKHPEPAIAEELARLREQVELLRSADGPGDAIWRRVVLSRHPQRPHLLDFIGHLCTDFSELHGDRRFADDPALVAGLARFRGQEVLILGQQRGRELKERIHRNFGQPKPEGYRKAMRLMKLAEKFRRPVLTLIDTQGAYPGIDAEERGQAEAIAYNLREMVRLGVPVLSTVIGEGGSGGALAIAMGDRVFMLENAIYSVISPEGCASIIWRDAAKKGLAAAALKITAPELLELGIIDEVIAEPAGGAHLDPAAAARLLGDCLERHLTELSGLTGEALRNQRYERFRRLGRFYSE